MPLTFPRAAPDSSQRTDEHLARLRWSGPATPPIFTQTVHGVHPPVVLWTHQKVQWRWHDDAQRVWDLTPAGSGHARQMLQVSREDAPPELSQGSRGPTARTTGTDLPEGNQWRVAAPVLGAEADPFRVGRVREPGPGGAYVLGELGVVQGAVGERSMSRSCAAASVQWPAGDGPTPVRGGSGQVVVTAAVMARCPRSTAARRRWRRFARR